MRYILVCLAKTKDLQFLEALIINELRHKLSLHLVKPIFVGCRVVANELPAVKLKKFNFFVNLALFDLKPSGAIVLCSP